MKIEPIKKIAMLDDKQDRQCLIPNSVFEEKKPLSSDEAECFATILFGGLGGADK